MPHPGDLLGDRYRLDGRIAAGGMGEVWQATDTVLGRDVAVKTLHAAQAGDTGFQTRFRHEARAMAVLHHPGVADVYDYGQTGTDAYIVMARVHGEPLSKRIAERGRLSPAETVSIVAQAGRALEAAHQAGIVHRDVKPGNLIIRPDGTVVLVDFGVARSAESAALTGAKEVVGTALYIAPEQVSKRTTGPAADVYALGGVAYHCLAGHPPFLGSSPIAVAMQHLSDDPPPLPEDVPPAVRALVTAAMAKEPADRFASAAAMADAADLALAGEGPAGTTAVLASPTRPATPGGDTAILPAVAGGSPRRRNLMLVAMALVVAATAAAVLAFVYPGGLLPGSPAPAGSVTGKASVSPSAGPTRDEVAPARTTHRSTRTSTTPDGSATATTRSTEPTSTTTATPGRTPTTEPPTTEPEQTAGTGAPATGTSAGAG